MVTVTTALVTGLLSAKRSTDQQRAIFEDSDGLEFIASRSCARVDRGRQCNGWCAMIMAIMREYARGYCQNGNRQHHGP